MMLEILRVTPTKILMVGVALLISKANVHNSVIAAVLFARTVFVNQVFDYLKVL